MTLQEAKQMFQNQLKDIFPKEEINNFFFLIIEKEFGYSKARTIMRLDEPVSMGESIMIHDCLNRLKKSEPIQYILGETEFYGIGMKVNRDTLIPRPETEELVDWIVNDVQQTKGENPVSIVDLGTGSGCIALALCKTLDQADVEAWDVSEGALKVARKNARDNRCKIKFERRDMLSLPEKEAPYDIIVSNPPYVRLSEKKEMKKNVLDYEPTIALYVPNDDPLLYYKRILDWGKNVLKNDGSVYFEINEYLGDDVVKLMKEEGYDSVVLKKDFTGRDRMIRANWNE